MVNIDPKEWDDMRKDRIVPLRAGRDDPELNDLDRMLVRKSGRITIPLAHSRQLPRIADQLRALAARFEILGADTNARERAILIEAHEEIRVCDHRIKNIASGRRPDGQQY